jgi:precorrin-6B C5,15-methyltransferase / cobalt-precorrin-6B C5,C15-methyltransferase
MAEGPWLTIVGVGEDGPDGLPPASHRAIAEAEVVMAPARHLALLPGIGAERIEWPVPFADGLPVLHALKGRRVAVLASGDPFWFGAGAVIARELSPGEWRALPGPSTFSLAAARLGWPLERTLCLGLHAAPLARLRPHLAPGVRAIVLLRDGAAVADLARYLAEEGFGATRLTVMEALGGPNERITHAQADILTGPSPTLSPSRLTSPDPAPSSPAPPASRTASSTPTARSPSAPSAPSPSPPSPRARARRCGTSAAARAPSPSNGA